MDKNERHTLRKVYEDPVGPDTSWVDVEHLFIGLGGYAKWSDKHHLTVELKGHKASFHTSRDKSSHLQAEDGRKVREFLSSAGITADMADAGSEESA
jgi:hypothetical protein